MQTPTRTRLDAVDVTRGVIMIIMALDHTRDYFGMPGQNPTNLATTSPALFFTRWITHFCAPVFFLLTGTGAYLSLQKKSRAELSRFLLTRGLWLMLLEVTVLRFAYQFNVDYHTTLLIVIWTLGISMIVLSGLVRLPTVIVTGIGLSLIAFHNVFDSARPKNILAVVLHRPTFLVNDSEHVIFWAYPIIPWVGVMAAGYGLGQVYSWDEKHRRAFLTRLGLALTAAFLVLRWINIYGDPSHWATQKTALFTTLSFLNTTKNAPSLLFLLMTLGPALLLLRSVDGGTPEFLKPARTIGRVPLFYFVLHFALIHAVAVVVCFFRYGKVHWMFESPDLANFPVTPPPGWGFHLPAVYAVWMAVVLMMYPLCRWFAALKQRRTDAWLSYL